MCIRDRSFFLALELTRLAYLEAWDAFAFLDWATKTVELLGTGRIPAKEMASINLVVQM